MKQSSSDVFSTGARTSSYTSIELPRIPVISDAAYMETLNSAFRQGARLASHLPDTGITEVDATVNFSALEQFRGQERSGKPLIATETKSNTQLLKGVSKMRKGGLHSSPLSEERVPEPSHSIFGGIKINLQSEDEVPASKSSLFSIKAQSDAMKSRSRPSLSSTRKKNLPTHASSDGEEDDLSSIKTRRASGSRQSFGRRPSAPSASARLSFTSVQQTSEDGARSAKRLTDIPEDGASARDSTDNNDLSIPSAVSRPSSATIRRGFNQENQRLVRNPQSKRTSIRESSPVDLDSLIMLTSDVCARFFLYLFSVFL